MMSQKISNIFQWVYAKMQAVLFRMIVRVLPLVLTNQPLVKNLVKTTDVETHKLLVEYLLKSSPNILEMTKDRFSLRAIADFNRQLQLVMPMDYPKQEILISASTRQELFRRKAVHKEPETVAWLETNMQPGDTLYDIGANVGGYSLIACAIVQANCTVYAFEPSFTTFATLGRNIMLNNFQKAIIPFHIALSSKTALVHFAYSDLEPGSAFHGINTTQVGKSPHQSNMIQLMLSYRIDDLVTQFGLRKPNLIKLDVDGHELQVLQGAQQILASPELRSVLVEVDYDQGERRDSILNMLQKYGFKLGPEYGRKELENLNYRNLIFYRVS